MERIIMGYSLDQEDNEEEGLQKEEEDYSTPFSPPSGIIDRIPKDHPDLDTDADIQEWYDAGRSAAAGVDDEGDKGIKGYHPRPEPPKNGDVKDIKKPKK
jgi:hypothetical protein